MLAFCKFYRNILKNSFFHYQHFLGNENIGPLFIELAKSSNEIYSYRRIFTFRTSYGGNIFIFHYKYVEQTTQKFH